MYKILITCASATVIAAAGAVPAAAAQPCKAVLPDGALMASTPYPSSSHSLIGYAAGDQKVLVGEYGEPNEWFPAPLLSVTAKDKDGFVYVIAKSPTGQVGSGTASAWVLDSSLEQTKQFVRCMQKRSS